MDTALNFVLETQTRLPDLAMYTPIRLLLVEPDSGQAAQIVETLRQAGYAPDWRQIESEYAFLVEIHQDPELILAEYDLPGWTSERLLHYIQTLEKDIPVIIIAANPNHAAATQCLKLGAADYLARQDFGRLGQAVGEAIEKIRHNHQERQRVSALLESERRYRQLVEASHEGIWVVDHSARTVYANPRMAEMLGETPESLIDRSLFSFLAPEWDQNLDVALIRRDGSRFTAAISTSSLLDEKGLPAGMLITVFDISERKRADDIRAAIYKVAQAAMTSSSLNELFSSIHQILKALIAAERFSIALYDNTEDEIFYPYCSDHWVNRHKRPVKLSHDLIGYVVRNQQSLLTSADQVAALVDQGKIDAPEGLAGDWLGVPLIYRDQTMGVMVVESTNAQQRFGLEELNILSFVSVQVAMSITRKHAEDEIIKLATTDSLTGVYNRRQSFELAHLELERARRYHRPLTIAMIDMDNLKWLNDHFGHQAGDRMIQAITQECRARLRKNDIIGRYGGDEFIVVLPETELGAAVKVVERLREQISRIQIHEGERVTSTTVSLGVVFAGEDYPDLEVLLNNADQALYAAKHKGKNRVETWAPPSS